MASAKGVVEDRGGWSGGKLLTGTEMRGSATIVVEILYVEPAPSEWKNPLVAFIDETHGCQALSLNKTNIRQACEFLGDDYEKWNGAKLTLKKIIVTNPTSGKDVPGIQIVAGSLGTQAKQAKKGKAPF